MTHPKTHQQTSDMHPSPYTQHQNERQPAGMSLVEMTLWIVLMAALTIGFLWLLRTISR